MTAITRRAIRVCIALTELKGKGADVLDALVPFFEPILQVWDGKVFDPRLFALGVQKLYRWRFTTDIAEQIIPRLEKAGFLERQTRGKEAIFLVRYKIQDEQTEFALSKVLEEIIDKFETFPPRVTDLLTYNKTRSELTDILVRFLVSLDAYAPAAFAHEIKRLALDEVDEALDAIEDGGEPLNYEDKYMAARFVSDLCASHPKYISDLSRLASIGLLAEVVEDFLKPTHIQSRSDLTIVVDAPIALDYLGCSGNALRDDIRCIFDALREIGCNVIALPITCLEMQRNLTSMLGKAPTDRHGYTHNAITRNEVLIEYVRAVANDPEKALMSAGIAVRPMDLSTLPSQHRFFSKEQYEDFLGSIVWVNDILPREHDATCLALTMRLRAGHHRSDLFQCKYVFVTRNPRFVRDARKYCVQSRMITNIQEGPIVHQRELATLAWLRTGLGASETVPRSHLLATCDRVLNLRNEVREAVSQKLKNLTPEKVQQYELLLLDQRSLRRLADQTLNDEKVITDENVEQLLDAMRRATAEDERLLYNQKLEETRRKSGEQIKAEKILTKHALSEAERLKAERDEALDQLALLNKTKLDQVDSIAVVATGIAQRFDCYATAAIWIFAVLLSLNYMFGWLANYAIASFVVGVVLALFGAYHQVMNALERPKIGLASITNFIARRIFLSRLDRAGLTSFVDMKTVKFSKGKVILHEQ